MKEENNQLSLPTIVTKSSFQEIPSDGSLLSTKSCPQNKPLKIVSTTAKTSTSFFNIFAAKPFLNMFGEEKTTSELDIIKKRISLSLEFFHARFRALNQQILTELPNFEDLELKHTTCDDLGNKVQSLYTFDPRVHVSLQDFTFGDQDDSLECINPTLDSEIRSFFKLSGTSLDPNISNNRGLIEQAWTLKLRKVTDEVERIEQMDREIVDSMIWYQNPKILKFYFCGQNAKLSGSSSSEEDGNPISVSDRIQTTQKYLSERRIVKAFIHKLTKLAACENPIQFLYK